MDKLQEEKTKLITAEPSDDSIKVKLALLDEQIKAQQEVYQSLIERESEEKTYVDGYGDTVCRWHSSTLKQEKKIFKRIDKLQAAKQRLITGESLPEVVYKDREVIKYIDRDRKVIHVYKSSFATSLLFFFLLILGLLALGYYMDYFDIVFKWKGIK